MKTVILCLSLLLAGLQYKLWVGKGSLMEVWHLVHDANAQRVENTALQEQNATLYAEVTDLKQGLVAIEERARSELGMIKQGETFYQLVDLPKQASDKKPDVADDKKS
jgi:cell division protein FtsB